MSLLGPGHDHPPGSGAGPGGDDPGPGRRLSLLTFEAGDYLFAVPSGDVERLLPGGRSLPEGMTVVDTVGLLPREPSRGAERRRGCYIVLADHSSSGEPVAVAASRAGDVRTLEPGGLLPLPGYLFPAENPFLGLIPPEEEGRRPVFVLAGTERLLACARVR